MSAMSGYVSDVWLCQRCYANSSDLHGELVEPLSSMISHNALKTLRQTHALILVVPLVLKVELTP